MNDQAALAAAARLEEMGITVRSPELRALAKEHAAFVARGGNRAMRRAARRAARRRGR